MNRIPSYKIRFLKLLFTRIFKLPIHHNKSKKRMSNESSSSYCGPFPLVVILSFIGMSGIIYHTYNMTTPPKISYHVPPEVSKSSRVVESNNRNNRMSQLPKLMEDNGLFYCPIRK
tara:strand:- start:313 stop:660 length:348 start_codon:yes stop_codon:yes gene_type:complete